MKTRSFEIFILLVVIGGLLVGGFLEGATVGDVPVLLLVGLAVAGLFLIVMAIAARISRNDS